MTLRPTAGRPWSRAESCRGPGSAWRGAGPRGAPTAPGRTWGGNPPRSAWGADGRRIPAGCLQVQDEAGRIPMGSPGQGGPGGAPVARGRARALCRSSGSRCSTPAAARALYERNAWRRAGNLLTLWRRGCRPSESSTTVQCNGRGDAHPLDGGQRRRVRDLVEELAEVRGAWPGQASPSLSLKCPAAPQSERAQRYIRS
jgi:hypothetical protein